MGEDKENRGNKEADVSVDFEGVFVEISAEAIHAERTKKGSFSLSDESPEAQFLRPRAFYVVG